MTHTIARVVRQWLIDVGVGSDQGALWPVFYGHEPDAPDSCLTVYATDGRSTGRLMHGEATQYHGVQVRVRAADADEAASKADDVREEVMSSLNYNRAVTVESSVYLVQNFNGIGSVVPLGTTPTTGQRSVHVLNAGVTVRQTT